MKISRSTEYGLLAVRYFAQHQGQGPITGETIARHYDIPLESLLKILQQLVRSNVLRSKRGPRGGFTLAKPTDEITLLDIIESIEGPVITSMHLAEQTGDEPFSIKIEQICHQVAQRARDTFEQVKLADVLTTEVSMGRF